jgi:tetratricopeptide (TPR) repeat protein
MLHQGEQSRLRARLSDEATALAMQSRWEEAVAANRNMIEKFPTDVEAHNRLGRALTELGEFAQAKQAYMEALELAPDNVIAKKNLARLATLSEAEAAPVSEHRRIALELFLTEIGEGGIAKLWHPAPLGVLARIAVGDQVNLRVKGQRLVVEDIQGEYLGEIEPKYESRLIKLIADGSEFRAAILSLEENEVKVIIKKLSQRADEARQPIFRAKLAKEFHPYTRDSLLRPSLAQDEAPEEEEEALPEGFSMVEDTPEEE